jgi:hypothetical protein
LEHPQFSNFRPKMGPFSPMTGKSAKDVEETKDSKAAKGGEMSKGKQSARNAKLLDAVGSSTGSPQDSAAFGVSAKIELQGPSPIEYRGLGDRRSMTSDEVIAAAMEAAQSPVDFPSISKCVVPGDRVVLAVDPNVPMPQSVIAGLLQSMPIESLEQVTIVLSEEASDELLEHLHRAVSPVVRIVRHQPDDREQLGYLAATDDADPIYLHRELLDAGLVIPVLVARPAVVLDAGTAGGGVYPALADRASQVRVSRGLAGDTSGREHAREEAQHVAWQLGIQVEVQILPSGDGGISAIHCGTPVGLDAAWSQTFGAAWGASKTSAPDLVVACLPGDRQQQTWENIARAVFAARQLVCNGGTIAVCSELADLPPPAVSQLGSPEPAKKTLRRLEKDESRFALPATVLLQSASEGRLLLLSKLRRETVEELGLGALDDPSAVQRLIGQHRRCVVLSGAQFGGSPAA